jgi:hypothetical protein
LRCWFRNTIAADAEQTPHRLVVHVVALAICEASLLLDELLDHEQRRPGAAGGEHIGDSVGAGHLVVAPVRLQLLDQGCPAALALITGESGVHRWKISGPAA